MWLAQWLQCSLTGTVLICERDCVRLLNGNMTWIRTRIIVLWIGKKDPMMEKQYGVAVIYVLWRECAHV